MRIRLKKRRCLLFVALFNFHLRAALASNTTDAELPNASDPRNATSDCFDSTCGYAYSPLSPLIKCQYLTEEFIECEEPKDFTSNATAKAELGYGCTKFGGQSYEDVERTRVWCMALAGIECYGERRFLSIHEQPCIRYTGHYFLSTLIYSVLLGFLGIDRFCLGHTGTAVGKLLTLGGVGVWWIIDVILLVTGNLGPADDSNWEPFY